MFHLLVKYDGWAEGRDKISQDRVFEYTADAIVEQFKPGGTLNNDRITNLPALFVSETNGKGNQRARVGSIIRAELFTKEVKVEYSFYEGAPLIPNSTLEQLAKELDIHEWEFSRTHWAIKNVDLFKFIFGTQVARLPSPKVFKLNNLEEIDDSLLSVMMPFDLGFDDVYAAIKASANELNLKCQRADNIWDNDAVMVDVVSLINRSRVVVCDCSGRNANVFYEIGIAHTLGRDVILITQSKDDIPFDVGHLRYVNYLNNGEGRVRLAERLQQRIQTLLEQSQ